MNGFVRQSYDGRITDVPTGLELYEDVYVREGFGPDESVLKEWKAVYAPVIEYAGGRRILDIGANIGMFARRAMLAGAECCTAFEPEAGAFSVLRHNLAEWPEKASAIESAIGTSDGTAELCIAPSGNAVSATTKWTDIRGRTVLQVPQTSFQSALKQHTPDFVKIDCEGAELDFLRGNELPEHVHVVVAELHRERDVDRLCDVVIDSFLSSGWFEIVPRKSYSFHRCWMVYFGR